MSRSLTPTRFRWASAILTVVFMVWSLNFPVNLFEMANVDDGLFWKLGESIARGNWLGDYDNLTLAKGPTYPMFLALNHHLGTPLPLLTACLYATSCWVILQSISRLGLGLWPRFFTYAVLLFHPGAVSTRVTRDNIYFSLVLISVAGLVRIGSMTKMSKSQLSISFVYGSAFGFFWVTREEGVWIIPGVLLLTAGIFVASIKTRQLLILRSGHFATYFSSALLVLTLISCLNYLAYGKFVITDTNSANFKESLKSTNSVQIEEDVPFVPVPEARRQLLYRVSPAFAELEPYLENERNGWKNSGCSIYPNTCGDFAGGWWQWAFRDAVMAAGYYTSPSSADNYYRRLNVEIRDACKKGVISCNKSVIPFMPNISSSQWRELPETVFRTAHAVLFLEQLDGVPEISWGSLERLNQMRKFLRMPTPNNLEVRTTITGWFSDKAGSWIALSCPGSDGGKDQSIEIDRLSSTDVAVRLDDKTITNNRFSFTVPKMQQCKLSLREAGSLQIGVPGDLREITGSRSLGFDTWLQIDSMDESSSDLTDSSLDESWATRAKPAQVKTYKFLLLTFTSLGLFAFIVFMVVSLLRRQRWKLSAILASSIWIMIASRILLLALVDVSSFPTITQLYLRPIYPLMVIASVVSIHTIRVNMTSKLMPTSNPQDMSTHDADKFAELSDAPGTEH
jgi:hypothetical protein